MRKPVSAYGEYPRLLNTRATLEHVPGAEQKVDFARFHVANLGDAVDQEGCQEHRALMKQGQQPRIFTRELGI